MNHSGEDIYTAIFYSYIYVYTNIKVKCPTTINGKGSQMPVIKSSSEGDLLKKIGHVFDPYDLCNVINVGFSASCTSYSNTLRLDVFSKWQTFKSKWSEVNNIKESKNTHSDFALALLDCFENLKSPMQSERYNNQQ